MKGLKHLVLDEADKLLDMDFEQEIDQILKVSSAAYPVILASVSRWLVRVSMLRPRHLCDGHPAAVHPAAVHRMCGVRPAATP